MLKINLKQLEAFVATAEFSSFTKAAEIMFLTQSTVSSHISALEENLGVRLIQRSARQRVSLTKEGELVYREARDILDRCQALQDLKNHQQQQNQLIQDYQKPAAKKEVAAQDPRKDSSAYWSSKK